MSTDKKDQVQDLPDKKIEADKAEQVKGGGGQGRPKPVQKE